jgi:drug/metabolite transporter (DMT)-like permease
MSSSPARWALWGSFAAIYLIWGSTFLGIRVAVETLPPLSMAAFRFLLAGAILMAASSRVKPRPTPRQWLNAAAVGSFFFLGNHGLITSVARLLPSSLVCLIIATEVPIIALLSSAFLGQPLTRSSMLGAALGLLGVVVLFGGPGAAEGTSIWACAAVLGGSLSWAIGVVLSQRLQFPPDAVLRAGMQMLCGGALLAVASAVRGEPASIEVSAFSARSVGALAYLIVFGSVLAFACYSYLLKHVRADAVATHVFVNPLVAVALGAWLAGEQLRPAHFVSGLLILASVCVITFAPRRFPPPAPETFGSLAAARPVSGAGAGAGANRLS